MFGKIRAVFSLLFFVIPEERPRENIYVYVSDG